MKKLPFWQKSILITYFSFYQPLAAVNNNANQVHRGALMLTGMFNALLLLNTIILIERLGGVSLLDLGIPFILLLAVVVGAFHLFLFTRRKWQSQVARFLRLGFSGKLGLGLIAFLGLPTLWILFVWQASTLYPLAL